MGSNQGGNQFTCTKGGFQGKKNGDKGKKMFSINCLMSINPRNCTQGCYKNMWQANKRLRAMPVWGKQVLDQKTEESSAWGKNFPAQG